MTPSISKHLKENNKDITEIKDISNTLAENFAKNSSSDESTDEFKKHRQQTEKIKLNFNSSSDEFYNEPFL